MLRTVKSLQKGNALDVACGIGKLSRDLLSRIFKKVDMFELDKEDFEEAKKLNHSSSNIGKIVNASMQEFTADDKYNMIVLRWCSGYLDDEELVHMLRIWRGWLDIDEEAKIDAIGSAIFILDNVTEPGEKEYIC